MFNLRTPLDDSIRHEHMINLLHMLLIHIRVPLHGRDASRIVDIRQYIFEPLENRTSLCEIVHVSSNDDTSTGILVQNRFHEIGSDIDLLRTTLDASIDGWTGIAVG